VIEVGGEFPLFPRRSEMLKKIKRIVILIILAFAAVVGWALYEGSQTQVAHLRAMDLLSEP